MVRRSKPSDLKTLKSRLASILDTFESKLTSKDLRPKVLALVPAFRALRDLGASIISSHDAASARERIEVYFRRYPLTVIHGDELLVVSGIQEYARRIRELRVEFGWQILSGMTFKQIAEDSPEESDAIESALGIPPKTILPEQYVLMRKEQDRDAAHRWSLANSIRKGKGSVHDKLLEYFKQNVGRAVSGEELIYVSGSKNKEWARRVRELRTEHGWAISTRMSGRPDLAVGMYVLEHLDQMQEHDRKIPDSVRVAVLKRDNHSCVYCGWNHSQTRPGDPRKFLELHHVEEHVNKGANTEDNLVTLCNVDHDVVHNKKHAQHRRVAEKIGAVLRSSN